MTSPPLLTPLDLGPLRLPNRAVMAPLTRLRAAMPGNVPNAMMATYYAQRAGAGLIVSEATPISATGDGYYGDPHLRTDEQEEGWRRVTEAVHAAGGRIFLQMWHVGRVSHPDLQPGGALPVAPSEGTAGGEAMTGEGPKPRVPARALTIDEIRTIVDEFGEGARRAIRAGFDGVEIHGANGYLLEQFLADGANRRDDRYGGSVEHRSRFAFEVAEAVVREVGAERVGMRLSPANTGSNIIHTDRFAQYADLIERLNPLGLAYLHFVEPRLDTSWERDEASDLPSSRFRPLVAADTKLISAGGHSFETANAALASGDADLVAFGRAFISTPDLVARFAAGRDWAPWNRSTFYSAGETGYIDYPTMDAA